MAIVTATGIIFWQEEGTNHLFPIRASDIEILGSDSLVIGTGRTDETGQFSISFDDATVDFLPGRQIQIRVMSQGQFRSVQNGLGELYSFTSDPVDLLNSNIDIPVTDQLGRTARAFSISEAIYTGGKYAEIVREAIPPDIVARAGDLSAGNARAFYNDATNRLVIDLPVGLEWDVILHEYGHFLSVQDGLVSPGAPRNPSDGHTPGEDNIIQVGKNEGTRLAWSEGLATYLSIASQFVSTSNISPLPRDSNGNTVETLGDLIYTDRSLPGGAIQDNIEQTTPGRAGRNLGEGDEASVFRILWDIADPVNDPSDTLDETHDQVEFGHEKFYQLLNDDIPLLATQGTLDNLWDHLHDNPTLIQGPNLSGLASDARRAVLGAIFEEYAVAPSPTSIDGADFGQRLTSTAPPTFNWDGGNRIANETFEVIIFNQNFSQEVLRDSINTATNWTPTTTQWTDITSNDGIYNFVVTGSDLTRPNGDSYPTAFQTGAYWSGAYQFGINQDPSATEFIETLNNGTGESPTADKFKEIRDGVFAALSPATEQLLEGEVDEIFKDKSIPLIGDKGVKPSLYKDEAKSGDITELPDPINFIGEARNTILPVFDALQALGEGGTLTIAEQLLFEALGPSGIRLVSSLSDINIAGNLDGAFTIGLSLSSDAALFDVPIEGDFGLPWLSLSVDEGSTVTTDFEFDFRFEFGLNESGEFFFNTPSDRDIELAIRSSMPDLALSGNLGFLQVDVLDEDRDNIADNDGVDVDGNGINPSRIDLGAAIDLDFSDGLAINSITPTGTADINLELQTSFDGSAALPSIRSDLNIDWDFLGGSFSQTDGNSITSEIPQVAFNDVQLDLGSFISDFAGPVLEKVQDVTDPIQPIVDILRQEISLAGISFSLLDVATAFGAIDESDREFLDSIAYVIGLVNALPTDPDTNLMIDLGSFDLGETDVRDATNLSDTTPEITKTAEEAKEQIPDGAPEKEFVSRFTSSSSPGNLETILSNPTSAFDLLLGKDVDLLVYDLPEFDFSFNFNRSIPVAFILITLAGEIGAAVDLGFGYDTAGLREFAGSGDPGDIFNGFFVIDGPEPELELRAGIEAAAGLGIDIGVVTARASVGGGILATIGFDLNDPNSDGKVRVDEILDLLDISPLCIFNVEGAIEASLFVELELKVGPFGFSERLVDERFPLASFHAGCTGNDSISLATENFEESGILQLHIGPNAFLRAPGDNDDGAEFFILERKSGDLGSEIVEVTAFDSTQDYNAGDRISGSGGDLYDVIQLDPEILTPAALEGNDGLDTLVGGSANDTLSGGQDADRLVGNGGDDSLGGDEGNDFLVAGPGADTIDGGEGNDIVSYENSNSGILLNLETGEKSGDVADDELISIEQYEGTNFSDSLIGDNQDNILDGLEGDDSLSGAGGNDILFGGLGADTLEGGTGVDGVSYFYSDAAVSVNLETDINTQGHAAGDRLAQIENLQGSEFDDTLGGDESNNFIDGYLGNDSLSGQSGNDSLHGYIGSDTIKGGAGDDQLFGDSYEQQGDATKSPLDSLFELVEVDSSNAFNDSLDGDAGDDFLSGDKGNDTLNGGTGSDRLSGGAGADELNGGAGSDVADYSNSPEGVFVQLAELGSGSAPNSGGDAAGDILTNIENIIGSSFDDTLLGVSEQRNVFTPGLGKDAISGGSGLSNTVVIDYSVNDIGSGLSNRNSFFTRYTDNTETTILDSVSTSNVTIFHITGTRQNDTIRLNSFLREDGEGDIISVGEGDDVVTTSNSQFRNVNDRVEGGTGNDTIQVAAGNDTVFGGEGDDSIRVDAYILSNDPFVIIPGQDGPGGPGQAAALGIDIVDGGDGVDTLSISLANQSTDIRLDSTDPIPELILPNGTEIRNFEIFESVRTGSGDDVLVQLGRLNNYFETGDGDDSINPGLGVSDTALGGDGIDEIILDYSVEDIGTGVTTFRNSSRRFVSEDSSEILDSINLGGSFERFNVIGTRQNDDISTNPFLNPGSEIYHDTLIGGAGDDTLSSFSGDDQVEGGVGNDSIESGNGNDTLTGTDSSSFTPGLGETDILSGGAGSDLFILGVSNTVFYDDQDITNAGLDDYAQITDFAALEDRIQLSGQSSDYELVESATDTSLYLIKNTGEPNELIAILQNTQDLDLSSTAFDFIENSNAILGTNEPERLTGTNASELIQGLGGGDRLIGRGGNDSIEGGDGNDHLRGGMENDLLVGGFGNDRLIGGPGNDSLEGGAGQDRFIFLKPNQRIDQILDFDASEDRIFLKSSGFDLPRGRILNTQFVLGNSARDQSDRLIYNRGRGKLFFDPDGTGSAQKFLLATLNQDAGLSAQSFQVIG